MNDIISPPSKWVSEMIARIEPGGTLIDIACGRGRHSIEFSKKFFIYSVDKNNMPRFGKSTEMVFFR